ncbi:hypothetical protein T09_11553, partial [Trichinella sp. T9]
LNKVCVATGLSRFTSRSEANVSQIAVMCRQMKRVRLRLQLKGNQDRKEENDVGVNSRTASRLPFFVAN